MINKLDSHETAAKNSDADVGKLGRSPTLRLEETNGPNINFKNLVAYLMEEEQTSQQLLGPQTRNGIELREEEKDTTEINFQPNNSRVKKIMGMHDSAGKISNNESNEPTNLLHPENILSKDGKENQLANVDVFKSEKKSSKVWRRMNRQEKKHDPLTLPSLKKRAADDGNLELNSCKKLKSTIPPNDGIRSTEPDYHARREL